MMWRQVLRIMRIITNIWRNRFKSQNTYGESYKNNKGHYDLISEGGQDFIIVYMSWNIYQEEIDWMNQVLQQYSDRKQYSASIHILM